jgi:uncharacterized protein (DUF2141 family)
MIRTISLVFVTLLALEAAANAVDLTVNLKGARNANGSVVAAIYSSKQSFAKEGQQFAAFRTLATTGGASVTFHDLPAGDYAVTAFHDENNNGKLDRDATGLPTEGYGVSNDARELLSPPFWDKASFALEGESKTISITIEY